MPDFFLPLCVWYNFIYILTFPFISESPLITMPSVFSKINHCVPTNEWEHVAAVLLCLAYLQFHRCYWKWEISILTERRITCWDVHIPLFIHSYLPHCWRYGWCYSKHKSVRAFLYRISFLLDTEVEWLDHVDIMVLVV